MLSCVLILPEAQVAAGDAVGEAVGWGPNSYSVLLSADGLVPATHRGLHAWVTDAFQQMIETGSYPPQVAEAGISQAEYDDMLAVLISSFWADYTDHFATVCADANLTVTASDA